MKIGNLGCKCVYDMRFDAYYDSNTGEYLEPVCTDKDCELCKDRPEKYEK